MDFACCHDGHTVSTAISPGQMKPLLTLLIVISLAGAPAAAHAQERDGDAPGGLGAAAAEAASEAFLDDWRLRFVLAEPDALPALLEEWREFLVVHGIDGIPREEWSPRVEQWRTLVDDHFLPEDVETALGIIACESAGDPTAKNTRSSATGLWQHLAKYWKKRSRRAGIPGASIFDPEASTIVAAWLVYRTGQSWRHWSCYR